MATDNSGNYFDPSTESANSGLNGYNPNGMNYSDNQPSDPSLINPNNVGAVIGGVGQLAGALQQPGATTQSANTSAGGYNQGVSSIQEANAAAQGMISPYSSRGAGIGDMVTGNAGQYQAGGAQGMTNLNTAANTDINPSKFYNPGMAFSMQQGQLAMERSAASRGGVINSGASKDISGYITGVASQNYNAAAGLALQNKGQQIGASTQMVNAGLNTNSTLAGMYGTGAQAAVQGANMQEQAGAGVALGQEEAANARAKAQANNGGSLGRILGAAGTVVGAVYGGPAGAAAGGAIGSSVGNAVSSDKRLKENIVRVGMHKLGIGLYDFDYIWGEHFKSGVMAQEVLQVMPQAVSLDKYGFYEVNYNMLNEGRA